MLKKYLVKKKIKKDLKLLADALVVYEFFLEQHGKDRPVPQTFRKWVKKMQVVGGLKL